MPLPPTEEHLDVPPQFVNFDSLFHRQVVPVDGDKSSQGSDIEKAKQLLEES